MGSIISAIHDDIEEYVDLCQQFGEEIRYTPDAWGNQIEDCYGKHASKLKERQRLEYAQQAQQIAATRRLVPKSTQAKKAKYEVVVSFMHGDADAYTSETFRAKTEDEAIRLFDSFDTIADAQGCGLTRRELQEQLKLRGCSEDTIALAEDLPRDVIYDGSGQLASISEIKILKDGIEMEILSE